MSDYFGDATLEDWLAEEVFSIPKVPPEIVAMFEKWRQPIEQNIEAWFDSDYGDGPASWRGWERGFAPVRDDKEFDAVLKEATDLLKFDEKYKDYQRY